MVRYLAGLCRFGYSVSVDYEKACLKWRGHHRTDIATDRGLYFLGPKTYSRQRHIPDNFLIAPVASLSPYYAAPEVVAGPSGQPTATNSKDYRLETYIRGSTRTRRGDDWVFTSDGTHSVRVHLRPRKTLFTPCTSMSGQANRDSICWAPRGLTSLSKICPASSSPMTTAGERQTQRTAYRRLGRERLSSNSRRACRRTPRPCQAVDLPPATHGPRITMRPGISTTIQLLMQVEVRTYSPLRGSASLVRFLTTAVTAT